MTGVTTSCVVWDKPSEPQVPSGHSVFLTLLKSTITLDPHKSGYVPYPAGGLCIRDERHRFLTTWTSPFINVNQENDIAMGIFGVEGRSVPDFLHLNIEICCCF